jgi:sigma-B regulation protein RsbU (phosphoserine phosphatase)
VFAADITTDQINTYTNTTVGGDGYTLLMDNKGKIISRPELSAGSSTGWNEIYKAENVFASGDPGLVAIGRNMTAGITGIEQVTFKGEPTFVAYAPVQSLNWSLAVSLPVAEVMDPVIRTAGHISASTLESTQHIRQQTDRIRNIFAGLFCLLFIVVIILSVYLARIITRPVDALREGTLALGEGNLDYRLSIDTGDEFEDLANSFNSMATDLKINIEELKRTTAEKERYAKEMEIAKEFQDSFLQESTPDIPGIEIAAITIPAMEIGGDLYDFIPVEGNRWGIVIADVSGKGVSAALFMALSCTLIHASGSAERYPSLAITRANKLIYEKSKSSMFITVFYGVLDAQRRSFSYVNAGHNPPVLVRGEPPVVHTLPGQGIALGVIDEVNLTRSELELEKGDLIALYTDGVTEAFNEQEEPFGEERFIEFLKKYHKHELAGIIPALLEKIRTFCGNAPQSDDITLVVMRVK